MLATSYDLGWYDTLARYGCTVPNYLAVDGLILVMYGFAGVHEASDVQVRCELRLVTRQRRADLKLLGTFCTRVEP